MEEIKKKLVDIFKLEDRVLYDAAGAADIVAAAEAEAQAQQEAADQAAEEARQAAEEAAKNAPPEDPSAKNEAEAGNAADIEAADDIDVDSIVDGAFADVDDADDMDFGADDITADAVVDDMRADDESETLYAEAFKVEAEEVRELVVINSSVKDAQKIIDSLGENTDVLILENGKDGLDQINDYLDENSDVKYSALHIVSHGNAGYFTLCGEVIDGEAVANDPASWASIGEHLTEDSDIMLYACNLAGNEEGQLLVSQIASLTNADVAASTDTTGVRGNWDLEYSIGAVNNEFISPADYNYGLKTYQVAQDYGVALDAEGRWLNANMQSIQVNGDYVYDWASVWQKNDVTEVLMLGNIESGDVFSGQSVIINNNGYQLTITDSSIAGDITVVGTGALAIDTAGNNVTVSGTLTTTDVSGSVTFADYSLFVTGTWSDTSGSISAGGLGTLEISGNFTVNDLNFSGNTTASTFQITEGGNFRGGFTKAAAANLNVSIEGTLVLQGNSSAAFVAVDNGGFLQVEDGAQLQTAWLTVNNGATSSGGGQVNVTDTATYLGNSAVLGGEYGRLVLGDANAAVGGTHGTLGNVTVTNSTTITRGTSAAGGDWRETWDIGNNQVTLAGTLTHNGIITGSGDLNINININNVENIHGTQRVDNSGNNYTQYGTVNMSGGAVTYGYMDWNFANTPIFEGTYHDLTVTVGDEDATLTDAFFARHVVNGTMTFSATQMNAIRTITMQGTFENTVQTDLDFGGDAKLKFVYAEAQEQHILGGRYYNLVVANAGDKTVEGNISVGIIDENYIDSLRNNIANNPLNYLGQTVISDTLYPTVFELGTTLNLGTNNLAINGSAANYNTYNGSIRAANGSTVTYENAINNGTSTIFGGTYGNLTVKDYGSVRVASPLETTQEEATVSVDFDIHGTMTIGGNLKLTMNGNINSDADNQYSIVIRGAEVIFNNYVGDIYGLSISSQTFQGNTFQGDVTFNDTVTFGGRIDVVNVDRAMIKVDAAVSVGTINGENGADIDFSNIVGDVNSITIDSSKISIDKIAGSVNTLSVTAASANSAFGVIEGNIGTVEITNSLAGNVGNTGTLTFEEVGGNIGTMEITSSEVRFSKVDGAVGTVTLSTDSEDLNSATNNNIGDYKSSLTFGSDLVSIGTININGADLTFEGDVNAVIGNITADSVIGPVQAFSTVTFSNSVTMNNVELSGYGATFNFNGRTAGNATVSQTSGTVRYSYAGTVDETQTVFAGNYHNLTVGAGLVNNTVSGAISVQGVLDNSGTFVIAAGGSLSVGKITDTDDASYKIQSGGTLTFRDSNTSTIVETRGSYSNEGSVILDGSLRFTKEFVNKSLADLAINNASSFANLTNSGTVTFLGEGSGATVATLNNNLNGTVNLNVAGVNFDEINNNRGTIELNMTSGNDSYTWGTALKNDGTIRVNGGTLNLGEFTQSVVVGDGEQTGNARFETAANGTIKFADDAPEEISAYFNNAGKMEFLRTDGTTVTGANDASFVNSGTITASGNLTFDRVMTNTGNITHAAGSDVLVTFSEQATGTGTVGTENRAGGISVTYSHSGEEADDVNNIFGGIYNALTLNGTAHTIAENVNVTVNGVFSMNGALSGTGSLTLNNTVTVGQVDGVDRTLEGSLDVTYAGTADRLIGGNYDVLTIERAMDANATGYAFTANTLDAQADVTFGGNNAVVINNELKNAAGTTLTFSGSNVSGNAVAAIGGTAVYSAAADQTVFAGSYNNLTLSGSGNKQLNAGNLTVDGEFDAGANTILTGNDVNGSELTLNFNGTITDNDGRVGTANDTVTATYRNTATTVLAGNYENLTIYTNHDAAARTVNNDVTVNNILTLTHDDAKDSGNVTLGAGVKLGGTIAGSASTLTFAGASGVTSDGNTTYAQLADGFMGNVTYSLLKNGSNQVVFGGTHTGSLFFKLADGADANGIGAFVLTGDVTAQNNFSIYENVSVGGADADHIYAVTLSSMSAGQGRFNGNVNVTYGDQAATVFGGTYNNLTLVALANMNPRTLSGVTVNGAFTNAGTTEVTDASTFNGTIGGSGNLTFSGSAIGSAEFVNANTINVTYSSADNQQIFRGSYNGNLTLSGGDKNFVGGDNNGTPDDTTDDTFYTTTINGAFANNANQVTVSGYSIVDFAEYEGVTNAGNMVLVQNGTLTVNREMVFGILTISNGSTFTLANAATTFEGLINNGTLNVSVNYDFGMNSAGTPAAILTNNGTMNIGTGAAVTLSAGTYNNGTINNSGNLTLNMANTDFGTVTNSLTLTVQQAVTFSQTMTNNGKISGNADITFNGATDGIGTVNMVDGTTVTYSAANTGVIFRGGYDGLTIRRDANFAQGDTTINGDLATTGTETIGGGSIVELAGEGDAGVGSINLYGGTLIAIRAINFRGTLTIGNGSTFGLNNANTTFAEGLVNNGTLNVTVDYDFGMNSAATPVAILTNTGTMNVGAGAAVTLSAGTYSDGTINVNAADVADNPETGNVDESTAGTLTLAVADENYGTITNAGTLNVAANNVFGGDSNTVLSNSNVMNVYANTTVTLNDGNYADGTINVLAGTETADVNGILNLAGAIAYGTVVNAGTVNLSAAGTFTGMTNNAALNINGVGTEDDLYSFGDGILTNAGAMTIGNTSYVQLSDGVYEGGTITNAGLLELAVTDSFGNLTNNGTLNVTASNSFGGTDDTALTNNAAMVIDGSGVVVDLNGGQYGDDSTITVKGSAEMNLNAGGMSYGDVSIQGNNSAVNIESAGVSFDKLVNGANLNVNADHSFNYDIENHRTLGPIRAEGTITIAEDVSAEITQGVFESGKINNSGNLTLNMADTDFGTVTNNASATLTVQQGVEFTKMMTNEGDIIGNADITFSGATYGNGSVTMIDGTTVTYENSVSSIFKGTYSALTAAGGTLVNGDITVNGTATLSGSYENTDAGSSLSFNGAVVDNSASINHAGTVTYGAAAWDVLAGTYGTLVLQGDASRTVSGITVNSEFTNAGTTTISDASTFNGTINGSGSLEFAGNAAGNAVFAEGNTIAATYSYNGTDAQTVFSGAYHELNLSGAGNEKLFNGTTTISGAFTNTAANAVVADGSSVTFGELAGTTAAGNMELAQNGTLTINRNMDFGTFVNNATLSMTDYDYTFEEFQNNSGAELIIGRTNYVFGAGVLTNEGTLTVNAGASVTLNTGDYTNGVISNYGMLTLAAVGTQTDYYGTLTNQNNAELIVAANNDFGSKLTNRGRMTINENVTVQLLEQGSYAGIDEVDGEYVWWYGSIDNAGDLTINRQNGGHFGAITNSGNLTATNNNYGPIHINGEFDNTGTLNGDGFVEFVGAVSGDGTVNMTGGTIAYRSENAAIYTGTYNSLVIGNGAVFGSGTTTVNGSASLSGTVTDATDSEIVFNNFTGATNAVIDLTGSASFSKDSTVLAGTYGTLIVAALDGGLTRTVSGITVNTKFTNAGDTNVTNASTFNGTIDGSGNLTFSGSAVGSAMFAENGNTVNVTYSDATFGSTQQVFGGHYNGSLTLEGGEKLFTQDTTVHGAFTNDASTARIMSGTTTFAAYTVDGNDPGTDAGNMELLETGTLVIERAMAFGSFTNHGIFTIDNENITFSGEFINEASGNLTVSVDYNLFGSSLINRGTLTVNEGVTLSLDENFNNSGTFALNGNLDLTGTDDTEFILGGTITTGPNGGITSSGGTVAYTGNTAVASGTYYNLIVGDAGIDNDAEVTVNGFIATTNTDGQIGGNAEITLTSTAETETGTLSNGTAYYEISELEGSSGNALSLIYQAGYDDDIFGGAYNNLTVGSAQTIAGDITVYGNAALNGAITSSGNWEFNGSNNTFGADGSFENTGSVTYNTDSVLSGTYRDLTVAGTLGAAVVSVSGTISSNSGTTLTGSGSLTLSGTTGAIDNAITEIIADGSNYLSVYYANPNARVVGGQYNDLTVNGRLNANVTVHGTLNNYARGSVSGSGTLTMAAGAALGDNITRFDGSTVDNETTYLDVTYDAGYTDKVAAGTYGDLTIMDERTGSNALNNAFTVMGAANFHGAVEFSGEGNTFRFGTATTDDATVTFHNNVTGNANLTFYSENEFNGTGYTIEMNGNSTVEFHTDSVLDGSYVNLNVNHSFGSADVTVNRVLGLTYETVNINYVGITGSGTLTMASGSSFRDINQVDRLNNNENSLSVTYLNGGTVLSGYYYNLVIGNEALVGTSDARLAFTTVSGRGSIDVSNSTAVYHAEITAGNTDFEFTGSVISEEAALNVSGDVTYAGTSGDIISGSYGNLTVQNEMNVNGRTTVNGEFSAVNDINVENGGNLILTGEDSKEFQQDINIAEGGQIQLNNSVRVYGIINNAGELSFGELEYSFTFGSGSVEMPFNRLNNTGTVTIAEGQEIMISNDEGNSLAGGFIANAGRLAVSVSGDLGSYENSNYLNFWNPGTVESLINSGEVEIYVEGEEGNFAAFRINELHNEGIFTAEGDYLNLTLATVYNGEEGDSTPQIFVNGANSYLYFDYAGPEDQWIYGTVDVADVSHVIYETPNRYTYIHDLVSGEWIIVNYEMGAVTTTASQKYWVVEGGVLIVNGNSSSETQFRVTDSNYGNEELAILEFADGYVWNLNSSVSRFDSGIVWVAEGSTVTINADTNGENNFIFGSTLVNEGRLVVGDGTPLQGGFYTDKNGTFLLYVDNDSPFSHEIIYVDGYGKPVRNENGDPLDDWELDRLENMTAYGKDDVYAYHTTDKDGKVTTTYYRFLVKESGFGWNSVYTETCDANGDLYQMVKAEGASEAEKVYRDSGYEDGFLDNTKVYQGGNIAFYEIVGNNGVLAGAGSIFLLMDIPDGYTQTVDMSTGHGEVVYLGRELADKAFGEYSEYYGVTNVLEGTYNDVRLQGQTVSGINFNLKGELSGYGNVTFDGSANGVRAENGATVNMGSTQTLSILHEDGSRNTYEVTLAEQLDKGTVTYTSAYSQDGILDGTYINLALGSRETKVDWTLNADVHLLNAFNTEGVDRILNVAGILTGGENGHITNAPVYVNYLESSSGSSILGGTYHNLMLVGRQYSQHAVGDNATIIEGTLNTEGVGLFGVVLTVSGDMDIAGKVEDNTHSGYYVDGGNLTFSGNGSNVMGYICVQKGKLNLDAENAIYSGVIGTSTGNGVINITGSGSEFLSVVTNAWGWYEHGIYKTGDDLSSFNGNNSAQGGNYIYRYNGTININVGDEGTVKFTREIVSISEFNVLSGKSVVFSANSQLVVAAGTFTVSEAVKSIEFGKVDIAAYYQDTKYPGIRDKRETRHTNFTVDAQKSVFNNKVAIYQVKPHGETPSENSPYGKYYTDWYFAKKGDKSGAWLNYSYATVDARVNGTAEFNDTVDVWSDIQSVQFWVGGNATFNKDVTNTSGSYSYTNPDDNKTDYKPNVYTIAEDGNIFNGTLTNSGDGAEMKFGSNNIFYKDVTNTNLGRFLVKGSENIFKATLENNYFLDINGTNEINDLVNTSELKFTNAAGSVVSVSMNSGILSIDQNSENFVFSKLVNYGTVNIQSEMTFQDGIELRNTGTIAINDARVTINTDIENGVGSKFVISGGNGSIINGDVVNSGDFTLAASDIVVNGIFTNKEGGVLNIAGSDFFMENVSNSGAIAVSGVLGDGTAGETESYGNFIRSLTMSGNATLDVINSGYLYVSKLKDSVPAGAESTTVNTVITVSDKGTLNFRDREAVRQTINSAIIVKGDGEVIYNPLLTTFAQDIQFLDWVIIKGDATLNGSTLTVNGKDEIVNANGKFRVVGGDLTVLDAGDEARFAVSIGSIDFAGDELVIGNKVDISSGSYMYISGENVTFNYDPQEGFAVDNYGFIVVNQDSSATIRGLGNHIVEMDDKNEVIGGVITVNGAVDFLVSANYGLLDIMAGGVVAGSISNANSGTVSVAGSFSVDSGVIAGTVIGKGGSISGSGDTLTFTGSTQGAAVFEQNVVYVGSSAMGGVYNQNLTINAEDSVAFTENTTVNGTFTNNTGITVSNGATVTLNGIEGSNSVYEVESGSTLVFNQGIDGGTINNAGTVTLRAESNYDELINTGNLEYAYANARYEADANGTGTVTFSYSGAEISGENYGTINVNAADATVMLSDNRGTLNLESAAGAASIALNSGSINANGDDTELTVDSNSGTITVSGKDAVLSGSNASGGEVIVNGSASLEMDTEAGSTVSVSEGSTMSIETSVFNGTLSNSGDVTVNSAVELTGILAGNEGVLHLRNDELSLAGKNVKGQVEVESENIVITDTTKVLDGGVLDIEVDRELGFSVITEGSGKLNVSEESTLSVTAKVFESNFSVEEGSQILFVAEGGATVSGDVDNQGNLGGETVTVEGNLSNSGSITADDVTVSGDLENTGSIESDNVTVGGDLSNADGRIEADNITVEGDLANSGSIVGGEVSVAGDLNNESSIESDSITVDGAAENNGSITTENATFNGETSGNGTVDAENAVYNGDGSVFGGEYGSLTVNGESSLGTSAEVGDMNLNGTLTVDGELAVNGATNGDGSINSNGDGKVSYTGDGQTVYEGQYNDLALNNSVLDGNISISGDAEGTFTATEGSNVTYNGTGEQNVLAGEYDGLSLIGGTKVMESGETYVVNDFHAEGTQITSSGSGKWTLDAANTDIWNSSINNANSVKPIELNGTNTATNSSGWMMFDAYGAIGDAAPGLENKNFSALASQLSEQLRGEELAVLYEDGNIFFRRRTSEIGSIDDLRSTIEDFAHEIDIEHFGNGFHGFELEDEEFGEELAMADALASEIDAALKEIVEHE